MDKSGKITTKPITKKQGTDIITELQSMTVSGIKSIDASGRTSMNSVFGESVIGQRIPSISAQFMYGIDDRNANDLSENGGSITFNNALLEINSGTASNGDGVIESKQALRYLPGHEAYCFFTTIFTSPVVNNRQEAGLFEENNGFWIGYKDTEFGLMRLRSGVEHWIPITSFQTDIITGDNDYNFILDATKGNVWKISYGYLGFANITLEVLCPCGSWLKVHSIQYPNMYTETHIANTYLPLRGRSINSGNTSNIIVKVGSVSAGIIDGGGLGSAGRSFAASLPAKSTSTNTVVAAFRNKTTFNSIANRIPALLERVAVSTDGAQQVTLALYKGSTLSNSPTWNDVDTNNSTLEYSTDATISATGSELLISFELFKTQNYVENVKEFDFLLYPGETAFFVASGNNSVKQSINWIELF